MANFSHSASSLMLEPLPDLDISDRHTIHHTLHPIKFVGALQPWDNFKAEVMGTYNSQSWNPQVLASKLVGNSLTGSVDEERVFVSDERGVQGRLEGRAGTALGAIFGVQRQDLKLGAFKGALPPYPGYKKAPDFVLMTPDNIANVLGEAKVSWIPEHHLRDLVRESETGVTEKRFRNVLTS